MHRPQRCAADNPIRPQDRQGGSASPDCRRRREQTISWEQLNRECAAGVDETLAASAQPERCRRRSPTDVDHDRQFDSEKAAALRFRRAPNAIQRVRSEPCVSVRGENYRCSRCMRPINGRPTLPNAFAPVATKMRSSRAGRTHRAHEKP